MSSGEDETVADDGPPAMVPSSDKHRYLPTIFELQSILAESYTIDEQRVGAFP